VTAFANTVAPRRAVILAAGKGSRLSNGDGGPPKPLARLNGRPLIDYTLQALAGTAIGEVLVVTGYGDADLRQALAERMPPSLSVAVTFNPDFESPASTSLRAARQWCADEPFLLVMSDHVFSERLLQRFLEASPRGETSVAADTSRRGDAYEAEATLLQLDGASVRAIGKGLPRWDALDAGAFIVQPRAWDVILACPECCELSVIFGQLASQQGLFAVDVAGEFWYDIDTAADLAAAGELLAVGC
jgi:choline kinase